MCSPFIFKKSRSFRKTQTSLLKVQTLARCLIFWLKHQMKIRKWLLLFVSKPFEAQGQGSRAKHEENEWDVHIVENLIILKLHYCLHDLVFQTIFLQSS